MVITEGPVDPKSPLFVGRSEELKTLQGWLASTDCVGTVMGARQTGKTSLLLKLRHTLRRKYGFAFIDLQAVEGADVRECFNYLAAEITAQLGTGRRRAAPLPGSSHEFLGFLSELSKETTALRSILILDELGALPEATALKLASTIRALFTSRLLRPEYAKYVVLLAGATDMLELATGKNSPLRNVTGSIYLDDLSLEETDQLLGAIFGRTRMQAAPEISRHLHDWTGGHPYWTQLLAGALRAAPPELTEVAVAGIVERLLPTENKNLPHVFKLLKDDQSLWNVVEVLLGGSTLPFSRSNPPVARLELIGLVSNRGGSCAIRNRIYKEALQQQTPPTRLTEGDLRRLSQQLRRAPDQEALLRLAVDEVRALLHSQSVSLFRLSADRLTYVRAASSGLPPSQAAVLAARGPLGALLESSFESAKGDADEGLRRCVGDLDCVAVVPIRHKEHVAEFFALGAKLNNRGYDRPALEFIEAVSEEIAACEERLKLREIEQDAARAREIQVQLLPKVIPQITGVQIAACWQPARSVSGDYYDVLRVGDQKMAVCIGDVVGKGMPAAIMMSNLQAAVHTRVSESMSPRVLCVELNRLMSRNIAVGKFITFFCGLIDWPSRRFTYSNAGHNPPVLRRANGDIQRLDAGGGVLGVLPDWDYQEASVELRPGDQILLFTDGASEVWNSAGEELGEDGLIALLGQNGHPGGAETTRERLMAAVSSFAGGNFADDVTLVVITVPHVSA